MKAVICLMVLLHLLSLTVKFSFAGGDPYDNLGKYLHRKMIKKSRES